MFDSLATTENSDSNAADAYHVGRVVFNDDPARQQRVKVTIPGYLTDLDPTNLPWVGPIAQSDFGNTATHGSVRVPVLGALLILKFQGGDRNKGLYVGYACTEGMGSSMPSELSTNYPNRYGYWDPIGNMAYSDLTTGESEFRHNSGTIVHFTASGDISITGNVNITGTLTSDVVRTTAGIGLAAHHHDEHDGPPTSPAVP